MTNSDITWAKRAARAFMRRRPVPNANAPAIEQAALIALWRARHSWNAARGVPFAPYARWKMVCAARDEIRTWNFLGRRRPPPIYLGDARRWTWRA